MNLDTMFEQIKPLDEQAMRMAQKRWNSVAKPLGSLGLLEDAVIRMAGMIGSTDVKLEKRGVIVMCADNGIVAQGVTQAPQEVTSIVTENMATGNTSVCCMAQVAKAEVIPVNIGCARMVVGASIRQKSIRCGTADFTKEPAMTRKEAEQAILVGIELVKECKDRGIQLLATGEMGIGNTTTSSAIVSVLLGQDPQTVTGRGAGLNQEGLSRKISVITQGIALHQPQKDDVLDVLSKVGGLDIAGLCGVFLGGALYQVPVLVDGFISSVAALCAVQLCPLAKGYMLASHQSNEPAGKLVLEALNLTPFVHGKLCLGEGTGALTAMPLLDMGLAVYTQMCTFEETNVETYEVFSQ